MKFIRTILTAAVSAAVATPTLAVELEKPDVYGFLSAGALKIESQDAEAEAFELELGLQGKAVIEEGLNLHYAVEVDLAAAANSADDPSTGRDGEADVHVKEAKFWLPTKYGLFVVAPRGTSGQWSDIYGPINHYEYNEPHADLHPDGIFAQPDRTSGTLAYHTPWFLKTKLVFAAITLNDSNDQNVDGRAVRMVHKAENLSLAVGTTMLMQEQLPPFATDDYLISAAGASYDIGGLTLGAVWENNRNSPYPLAPDGKADFDSYGVSANYVTDNGAGIALGYKEKDHDFDAADENVYTLKVEQRLTPHVKVWAETGQYDVQPSNYAVGFNLTF
ncbi:MULTISPECIES: porin [Marinobacter]|uniref:porin n=1 Tax=Marinobacter TaxID=2742 RepID=UPI001246ADD8|nr:MULTISPECIES: porin [Marinobacter]MBL3556373.1 porin [Marinobacter sp. JB05H06]